MQGNGNRSELDQAMDALQSLNKALFILDSLNLKMAAIHVDSAINSVRAHLLTTPIKRSKLVQYELIDFSILDRMASSMGFEMAAE